MALRNLYFTLFICASLASKAQTTDTVFKKDWAGIDSLIIKQDLTRTALEKVNILYQKAKQRRLAGQMTKALLYRFSLEDRITTDDPAHSIKSIRAEISTTTDEVHRAVLYSLLAKQYRYYYQNHRWNLYNRRNTAGPATEDITAWNNDDFIATISKQFLQSLKNKSLLQQTPVSAYDAVIIKGNDHIARPSLYDLLAHEALDFFRSGESYTTKPVNAFTITDPNALAPMEAFTGKGVPTKDSTALQWLALEQFRGLLLFHRNDADKNALITIDLERIEWVYQQALLSGKESAYQKTLQNLIDQYPAVPAAAGAWYLLARKETEKAGNYSAFGDTTNRYGFIRARELIERALKLFPIPNNGTANLQNLLTEIRSKQLRTETERVNIPYKPFRALVTYRNTDTLFARIIRIEKEDARNNNGEPDYWKKISKLPAYRSFTQILPATNDHQVHTAEIKIEGLPVGEYAILSSNGSSFNDTLHKMSLQSFHVSNISYLRNKNDYFVLNRESGQPLSGVKVLILKQQYINRLNKFIDDTVSMQTTNKNGYFRFESLNANNFRYVFTTGTDRLSLRENEYAYYDNQDAEESPILASRYETVSNRVFFFTDRSIYRPGQQVFFKGIAVTRDYKTKFSKSILSKDSGWVYLKDVNRKPVDSIRFALNSYGSFAGKFQLPQNGLTGIFSIELTRYNRSAAYISVEEYKRPKFNVQFDKVKGAYRLNDTIVVTGTAKAYAGNTISGAKVTYNISRNTRYMIPWMWWRRPIPQGSNRQVANGEIVTDAEGKFTIKFKALADDIADSSGNPLFDFTVQTDVTDLNGETRSATTHVSTGFSSLLLSLTTAPTGETDSTKTIFVHTTNLSNEKEPALVQVKIYALQPPGRLVRKRYWQRPDQFVMSEKEFVNYFPTDEYANETDFLTWEKGKLVYEGTVDTKDTGRLALPPGSLEPGHYRIEASTRDGYGVEVKQLGFMQLFSRSSNRLPVPAYQFNYVVNGQAEPGQTASFLTGTTAKNVFVISKTEKPRQKSGSYDFDQRTAGIRSIQYTADESDRGGVNISEAYVYDNRIYTNQYPISVPWTNKQLKVSYASYRDKTEPGAAEKWTVTVEGPKGEETAAELLTGMYDASLDQFKPHNWNAPPLWETNYLMAAFGGHNNFSASNSAIENYVPEKYIPGTYIAYDRLATNGYELWSGESNMVYSSGRDGTIMIRGNASMDQNKSSANGRLQESALQGKVAGLQVSNMAAAPVLADSSRQASIAAPLPQSDIIIRKNFNETAFFFPQLYADSTGKYSFSFTIPEALTQWKWMSLAHTKDLAFGANSTTVVTQKKMMVQPNAPRFMREGDHIEFSTKIANLTDKEITGQVTLELIDATTNTSVDGWFQNVFPSQYFTVVAGQSSAIKFPVQIPYSFNRPLTWRIVAKSGNMSDGEENTLPILTNRTLVTESLPLFLQGDTTKTFRFDKLLNTTSESLTHHAITVEYTSNPIWYAVQALPYLMEYPYECSEQTFNRFYANALAAYIVNKHPRIRQVFEKWKGDTASLKSNLQKNEELKQVLLEETPWVLQAESEEQQKKNISLLFDLVKLSTQSDGLIEKLRQMQLPNGSFSWFRGGYEDRYITNYILTGIGKLKRLGALTPDLALRIRTVLVNALKYADGKIADDYNWLIKNKVNLATQQLSASHIDYLYMRSFFGDIAQQSPVANDYFYKQGKQYWTKQNSYYKAKLGLIYYRNREENFATATILPALLENASTDTKMGMYWKSAYTGFWHQSAIEHQSMMIAFMSEINADGKNPSITKDVNAMKTWLLLNKQTNNWRTTIATADACYALLLNGSDWLNSDKTVTIRLGTYTTASNIEKTEAGTGYFKKRIDGRLVNPGMGNITVTVSEANKSISQSPNLKISQSPSWGSVYWQYFEDLDKITPSVTPLSLIKKLFIERNTDKGKLLVPVKEGDELKTGDKVVVRMELRSDRAMDYLHLKDMRAAAMEPVNVLSAYKWQDGLGYYESTRDASTNFFISHLAKGTYVFEYPLFITHTGIFSVGIATIQCMYAPEFTSHSEGIKIRVGNPNP